MSKLELKAFISETTELVVTDQATKRVIKILDANYQKADLIFFKRETRILRAHPGLHLEKNKNIFPEHTRAQ